MLESEKFAIAAHLHVLLRRTNGRVTDVEWMIRSPEYAHEVIRVARTEAHPDLHKLADKLEAVMQRAQPLPAPQQRSSWPVIAVQKPPTAASAQPAFAATDPGDSSSFPASTFAPSGYGASVANQVDPKAQALSKRYVGTLR